MKPLKKRHFEKFFWRFYMKNPLTKAQAKELLEAKLLHYFGVSAEGASYDQLYRAVAMILKDLLAKYRADFSRV